MDRGQGDIILVLAGGSRLIARHRRRIQGEFRQEPLASRVLRGQLFELLEVTHTRPGSVVDPLELRLVPFAHQADLSGPRGRGVGELLEEDAESLPVHFYRLRRVELA